VSLQASAETGLPAGTPILAGASDGVAGLIASGASLPGHANTTLGTTLIWKSLTKRKPNPAPGVYCHLHPSGLWAPGAASNTGMGSLTATDQSASPAELDRLAAPFLPTRVVCYFLPGQGERFPFVSSAAETFVEGEPRQPGEWHAAQLQSIAFAERWGYEVLERCGVDHGDVVFSAGGAARSPILSQLRSHVLKRTVVRCRYPTAAFGAAILTATGALYSGDVSGAIQAMTTVCESYSPSDQMAQCYDEIYGLFREACTRRGYAS
jgi:sugar (pentulose or hexulose) kinase